MAVHKIVKNPVSYPTNIINVKVYEDGWTFVTRNVARLRCVQITRGKPSNIGVYIARTVPRSNMPRGDPLGVGFWDRIKESSAREQDGCRFSELAHVAHTQNGQWKRLSAAAGCSSWIACRAWQTRSTKFISTYWLTRQTNVFSGQTLAHAAAARSLCAPLLSHTTDTKRILMRP